MITRAITRLTLGLFLLLLSWTQLAQAGDDGQQDVVVEDPQFGEVLYYFYQEDYFPAIVRLLAAKKQQQFVNHADEADLLLGGLYLMARKMMNWRIPAGIFIAVIVLSGIFYQIDSTIYPSPVFMLFSGGLMLGALFMATDMVASPVTAWGCFVYGLLIGILVVVIRLWGGMPEGVMYAILFANALSPHLDRLIQPVPYGLRKGQ